MDESRQTLSDQIVKSAPIGSANGGVATKRRMPQLEGALPADEPTLF